VVVLGVLAVTIPFDPNPRSPATSRDVDTVEIADLAVAVTDSEPVATDPDVWLGLKGPAPAFDTSSLGPDLSFTPGEPSVGDLEERNMRNDGWPTAERAVYLGELEGEPFYIFSAAAPSIWDRIFEVIGGNFSGDVLGTSLNCCTGGDMDHGMWVPGISYESSTTADRVTTGVITAEWLGLSTDVSVVAYQLDGMFIGWQTPVGGVSSLSLDQVPDEYLGVAFDASGRELDRFGTELEPFPDTSLTLQIKSLPAGSDWAPMTSDGAEIQPEDIPTDELRDAISDQPGDRLFLVPVDGGEIIVLVRGGVPNVYAASCAVLDGVDLPQGWEETCLG
jgi:hypothetical protein